MKISDLAGRTICILGFGKEGRAMADALEKYAPGCKITIADQSESLPLPVRQAGATRYPLITGADAFKNLSQFDILIKSPGISPYELSPSLVFTSPTQIFFDSIAHTGATVIGITGSKGKSTTSSLIHQILAARYPLPARSGSEDPSGSRTTTRTFLIGNIGNPAISYIGEATNGTIFVMEMSSYQLMDLSVSPKIAILTSFFPEHLDYHRSLKSYMDAKKHITKFQGHGDSVYFNAASAECEEIAEEGEGKKIGVSGDDCPVDLSETKLIGGHNRSNIALAWKVAEALGVTKENATSAIKTFTPLPHRLQSLGVHHGYEWINDSISTTPESCIAALDALGDRVSVLILGGKDRGLDFSGLAERIMNSNVQLILTIGEDGKRIAEIIKEKEVQYVETLVAAVRIAKEKSSNINHQSSIVLLSPASPSYDQFKNFEERGNAFQSFIKNL
ncbi:MAG: UDP-N-acetylmuramoyl-L-alanine--D-glutamate ligase [Candidatus Peribacteraceae bacterium]